MLRFVSTLIGALVGALALSYSFVSVAGDCNKTVMGGGCTAEVNAGVAAHMRSQSLTKPVATKTTVKPMAVPVNVKMSKPANQKI